MPEFQTQNALVLSVRALGEKSFMLSLFTKEAGKHLGVIKRKTPPDIASFIDARWQARLIEQCGSYYIEDYRPFASAFLDDKKRLATLSCICYLLDKLLPERQENPYLYEQTLFVLDYLDTADFLKNYVFWELNLLSHLGFGLDFSDCAGGGDKNNLAFVSPNTGRAVSLEKGIPYQEKLLKLPQFLWKDNVPVTQKDLQQALTLTGFFLYHKAGVQPLPALRDLLLR